MERSQLAGGSETPQSAPVTGSGARRRGQALAFTQLRVLGDTVAEYK